MLGLNLGEVVQIFSGQECEWPSEDEDEEEEELAEGVKEKAKAEEVKAKEAEKEGDDQAKGVPGFWLTIFKNVEMLAEMVQASPFYKLLKIILSLALKTRRLLHNCD